MVKWDLFPKNTVVETSERTWMGTITTAIALLIVIVLFISELRIQMEEFEVSDIDVDVSQDVLMPIVVNITFPHVSCKFLTVDAADVSGNSRYDISSNIIKTPINSKGKQIAKKILDYAGSDAQLSDELKTVWETPQNYCGSCHLPEGRKLIFEPPEGHCCNTCGDVIEIYRRNGIDFSDAQNEFEQCYREALRMETPVDGCRLDAYLEVPKVVGAIMIAPGRLIREAYRFDRMLTSDSMSSFQLKHIRMAHKIEHISFGDTYPGMISPLDGVEKKMDSKAGTRLYKYFVKVVPTLYGRGKNTISANQYSVTEHSKEIDFKVHRMNEYPSVSFRYSMSGLKVHVSMYRRSVKHFLTHTLSIIGGVFVCLGLVHHSVRKGISSIFEFVNFGQGKLKNGFGKRRRSNIDNNETVPE